MKKGQIDNVGFSPDGSEEFELKSNYKSNKNKVVE